MEKGPSTLLWSHCPQDQGDYEPGAKTLLAADAFAPTTSTVMFIPSLLPTSLPLRMPHPFPPKSEWTQAAFHVHTG
jgi:hypothetical protein